MASVTHDPALQSHATRKYLPSMFPPKDATDLNLHYWYVFDMFDTCHSLTSMTALDCCRTIKTAVDSLLQC